MAAFLSASSESSSANCATASSVQQRALMCVCMHGMFVYVAQLLPAPAACLSLSLCLPLSLSHQAHGSRIASVELPRSQGQRPAFGGRGCTRCCCHAADHPALQHGHHPDDGMTSQGRKEGSVTALPVASRHACAHSDGLVLAEHECQQPCTARRRRDDRDQEDSTRWAGCAGGTDHKNLLCHGAAVSLLTV